MAGREGSFLNRVDFVIRGYLLLLLFVGDVGRAGEGRMEPLDPVLDPAWLQGYWQDAQEPDFQVGIAESRLMIAFGGRIREVVGFLHPTRGGILGCEDGREVEVSFTAEGQFLQYFDKKRGKSRKLLRRSSAPEALSLLLKIPPPVPLAEERVLAIQRELWARHEGEQSMFGLRRVGTEMPWGLNRSVPDMAPKPDGIDLGAIERLTSNAESIRSLVSEVGWIDVGRFGYPASQAAFFIVQHSWDPSLMLSVLPFLKKDVDAGLMDSSAYALLLDRTHLAMGLRQQFGSQLAKDDKGDLIVLPVEAPEQVEARRRELGLISLREYVGILGAQEVKFSSACSVSGPASGLPHDF